MTHRGSTILMFQYSPSGQDATRPVKETNVSIHRPQTIGG